MTTNGSRGGGAAQSVDGRSRGDHWILGERLVHVSGSNRQEEQAYKWLNPGWERIYVGLEYPTIAATHEDVLIAADEHGLSRITLSK